MDKVETVDKTEIEKENSMTELENYLHNECRGKQNAVTSLILERRFHCKGTEIRSMVNDLRCAGVPICSGRKGYYYADSIEDVAGTVANLESRIRKMREAQKGLLNEMKELLIRQMKCPRLEFHYDGYSHIVTLCDDSRDNMKIYVAEFDCGVHIYEAHFDSSEERCYVTDDNELVESEKA